MSTFFDIDCSGDTVTIEKTNNGDLIFHGYDEDAEMAAVELGFEPSPCWIVWTAINNDDLGKELHNQSYRGNDLLVKVLLFAGANVEAEDKDGYFKRTPLHVAATNNYTNVVKILLEAGASLDATDRDGWTPLHEAAMWNHADVAKVLLEAGASVDARNNTGHTPLGLALWEEKYAVISVIKAWIEEHSE